MFTKEDTELGTFHGCRQNTHCLRLNANEMTVSQIDLSGQMTVLIQSSLNLNYVHIGTSGFDNTTTKFVVFKY